MKQVLFYVSLILSVVLSSCLNKKLDISLIEPACKKFRIEGIRYGFTSDPTCDSAATSGEVWIKGEIDGELECFDYMEVEVKFYDINDVELTSLTGATHRFSRDEITIDGNTFTINIPYTFAPADYKNINYIHLNYHSENELGSESNELNLRANPPCAPMQTPSTYEETITVSDSVQYIVVKFYDNASEDGDLVSLNVNGSWVLQNILLTNAGTNYNIPVVKGTNWLNLYALNQGSSGPNTVSITVFTSNPADEKSFSLNMKTGENKAFQIVVQ